METSSQPPQPQRTQTQEEFDLKIIDLPDRSEAASNRHAWLWHTILQVQRAVDPRSWRLIQTCFTLLLALIATLLILSSFLHPLTSSPVITPDQHELVASSDLIHYERNPLTVYRGHRGPVRGVAWSPDSTRIASVSLDATAQIWDARTGKSPFLYEGHGGFVNSLAWSPNGAIIASGGQDGTIQVWNVFLGQNIVTFLSQANSVAWSPGGSFIATGGTDGLVKLWPIARPTYSLPEGGRKGTPLLYANMLLVRSAYSRAYSLSLDALTRRLWGYLVTF